MKNIWTKVATILISILAGLTLSGVALAAEATNSNTGANSNNESKVEIKNDVTISSNNNTVINNTISISANTGGNSADKNTGDGTVSTGDITGSVSVTNTGNMNGVFDSILNLNCNCDFSASNSTTGADSNNESKVSVKNDINITVNSNANVNNNVDADLNTGGNSADKNTGNGSVSTGDIDFSVEIVNDLNKNFIGGPTPQGPADPGSVPPAILPTTAKPGQVLAAVEGLPITGSNLPSWPFLLVAIGFALKIIERVFKVKLIDEVV